MILQNHDNSLVSKSFGIYFSFYNVTECNKQIKSLKFFIKPADKDGVR